MISRASATPVSCFIDGLLVLLCLVMEAQNLVCEVQRKQYHYLVGRGSKSMNSGNQQLGGWILRNSTHLGFCVVGTKEFTEESSTVLTPKGIIDKTSLDQT
ncbi:hypothetical protein IFM89_012525 [Coptis chinensis]|uniref:Secreted protein n=1 Tax=Coptis chinensis TaxID=261450 RepID=A0A835HKU7_9MAGN|nr:hypothetical protein IFM89_012525 [Coptis chinensis]